MTLNAIVQSPYFTLSMALLTLLSIILAIAFFRKSQRRKKPLFEIARRTVIENSIPVIQGLSVQFNGEEQPRITVAHLWFWNQGTETIRASDVPEASPLGIEIAKGATLLSAQVVRVTDTANQCSVDTPKKREDGSIFVPMNFDYLDHHDGMVIQLVHNAEASHRIRLSGKIMGVESVKKAADAFAFHVEHGRQMAQIMRLVYNPRKLGIISILLFFGMSIVLTIQAIMDSKWILLLPALLSFLLAGACYPMYLRSVIPKSLSVDISDAQQSASGDAENCAPEP